MALSDCPRCWNTPCTCGYMGYTVQYHPGPSRYELDNREEELKRRIKALEDEIKRLKNEHPYP